MDEECGYVSPHDYLALLFEYLVRDRGMEGIGVRSTTTGSLMDRVAASLGRDVVETPVGFKHLGAVMLERSVVLAGEESGGLSIGGHVPEKDGILACLLACEMCARRGVGLAVQLRDLWSRYGRLAHRRIDLGLADGIGDTVRKLFIENTPPSLGDLAVERVDSRDGRKLVLAGGASVLVRMSGTEPLARFYIESGTDAGLDVLESSIRAAIGAPQG